jgi:TNF receptor-associated factor 4
MFHVFSQGNRYALEKHVDDNTKQHLVLMCSVVTKQQHQISSLKSALSRLSLNYSGNHTTSVSAQIAH